jgi:protein-disulfide isomerase
MSNKNLRTLILSAFVIIAIIITLIILHKPALKLPKTVKIDTQSQPFIGNKNANNNVVVFEDMKCVNCMRYNTTLFPKIKKAFIDNGKVKYTIITLAFLPGSSLIANAALCVKQQNPEHFFPYVEYIYHHQGDESQNWGTVPRLLEYAKKVNGIDIKNLSSCLVKAPFDEQINSNMKVARDVMGAQVMTPRVYINGVLVEPLTFNHFEQVYDQMSK